MQQGVIVRVFVASPGDVTEEREEACRVIHDWNAAHSFVREAIIEPVRVESHPQLAQGAHPQDLINGQLLERCDLLVAVFWSRIGSRTASALSGTIQELQEFADLKGADRVMLFFSKQPMPSDIDLEQLTAVRNFKADMQSKGLYKEFQSTSDFARQFRQQLELAMNQILNEGREFGTGSRSSPDAMLSPEACTLLVSAGCSNDARIMASKSRAGMAISANRVIFSRQRDAKSEAKWKGALEELEHANFVEATGDTRQVFRLTRKGHEKADNFWRVLLLREVERRQNGASGHVTYSELKVTGYLGQQIPEEFMAEKFEELDELGLTESSEEETTTLTGRGRNELRKHMVLQFAYRDV